MYFAFRGANVVAKNQEGIIRLLNSELYFFKPSQEYEKPGVSS